MADKILNTNAEKYKGEILRAVEEAIDSTTAGNDRGMKDMVER